jgi:ribose transport system permease protein
VTSDSQIDTGERRPEGRAWSSDQTLRAVLAVVQAGPVVILVLLASVMSILSPVFLTTGNLENLAVQTSIVAAVAIGQLLVVLTRGVDLSVGSVVGLSGVVGALVATSSVGSGFTALVVMPLVGAAVGLVNGFILVKLKVPHPLIVTLATLGIVRGLALQISGGETLVDMPPAVVTAGSGELWGLPVPVLIVVGMAALFAFMTRRTKWGRWIYAIGGNPEAAERAGLPVSKVLLSAYILCGLTAGVAGLLTAGRTAAGSPNAGILLELDALTAVIVGGASFFGGRGTIWNVVVGALIIGLIRNGLNLLNVTPFYQQMAVGTLILVAIQLDVVRARLETRLQVVRSLRQSE